MLTSSQRNPVTHRIGALGSGRHGNAHFQAIPPGRADAGGGSPPRRRKALTRYAGPTGAIPPPATPRNTGAAVERPVRRLRRSQHDAPRRSARRPRISTIASSACGRWPRARHHAPDLRRPYRRADARSAHHGSARQPARVHQVVLGLSRHPGDRRAHRARPRAAREIPQDLRRGRARLRRRPLHHRRDLGRRDQLRHRQSATGR